MSFIKLYNFSKINNDALKKQILDLLNKCYELSSDEILSTKGIIEEVWCKCKRIMSIDWNSKEKSEFEGKVVKPIESFFKAANSLPKPQEVKNIDEVERVDGSVVRKFSKCIESLKSSLEDYASDIVNKIDSSMVNFESMPAVCVFARILLGLAGINKLKKFKDKLNKTYRYNDYLLGSGIFSCLAYNTLVTLYGTFVYIKDYKY